MIGKKFIYTSPITGYKTQGIVLRRSRILSREFDFFQNRYVLSSVSYFIVSTVGIAYDEKDIEILD